MTELKVSKTEILLIDITRYTTEDLEAESGPRDKDVTGQMRRGSSATRPSCRANPEGGICLLYK